jgi:hypothetical protein
LSEGIRNLPMCVKISETIMEINDLRKAVLHQGASVARYPVAADVSRRILDDDACLGGRPKRALATAACVDAPGPPTCVGSYELAWPYLTACPSSFRIPFDALLIHHADDFTPVRERQKTYRRLFGMIFFGGLEPLLIP